MTCKSFCVFGGNSMAFIALIFSAWAFAANDGWSQQETKARIEAAYQATVAFDINFELARASENVGTNPAEIEALLLSVGSLLEEFGFPDGMDWPKIKRISGLIRPPNNEAELENVTQNKAMDLDFVVRVFMDKTADHEEVLGHIKSVSRTVEINGRSLLKPPTSGDPFEQRLAVYIQDEEYVEVGTDRYLTNPGLKLSSEKLAELVNKSDARFASLCFDGGQQAGHIQSIAALLQQFRFDEEVQDSIDAMLVEGVQLHANFDFDAARFFEMSLETAEAGQGDVVRGALEGLVKTVQVRLDRNAAEQEQMQPMNAVIQSLQISQQGAGLFVERSEKTQAAVKQWVLLVQQAQAAELMIERIYRLQDAYRAIRDFADTHEKFPFGAVDSMSEDLSWRVKVLPFLWEPELEGQFDPSQAWDSDFNAAMSDRMPTLFGAGGQESEVLLVLPEQMPSSFADIADGAIDTIALVLIPSRAVPWTQPVDISVDEVLKAVQELQEMDYLLGVTYGGQVYKISKGVDLQALRSVLEPADGQRVRIPNVLPFAIEAKEGTEEYREQQLYEQQRYEEGLAELEMREREMAERDTAEMDMPETLMESDESNAEFPPGAETGRTAAEIGSTLSEAAERLTDDDLEMLRSEDENALMTQAIQLFHANEHFRSIAYLERLLELNPLNIQALYYRGSNHYYSNKHETAVRDLNAVIGLDEEFENVWALRGHCWLELESYERALSDYDQHLKLRGDEGQAIVFANRGFVWGETGNAQNAVRDYSRAIEINEEFAYAYSQRGFHASDLGDFALATSDYQKAIELDPRDAYTISNLAWLLTACPDEAHRDASRALELAQRACEMTGWKEAWMIDNLGAAYASNGDFEKAIELAMKAMEMADSAEQQLSIKSRIDLYRQNKPAQFDRN